VLKLTRRPRMAFITRRCDLIHTASGVLPVNRKPFVVSAEYYSSFVGLQHDRVMSKGFLDNTIKRLLADNCKKILPFSNASAKSILNSYGLRSDRLQDKIEVLYPAIEPRLQNRREPDGRIRVLHIGSAFFEKGGRELFEAVDFLTRELKMKIDLVSITSAPHHYRDKFLSFIHKYERNENFRILTESVDRAILFREYYSKADIFVLPTFGDFFGYVYLEAMACGLPLIGTNVFAVPEIVVDGRNGFLVDCPISPFKPDCTRKSDEEVGRYLDYVVNRGSEDLTKQLSERIRIIAEDEDLRRRMGKESLRMVSEGKFSIAERHKKLKRIYDDSLSG